MFIREIFCKKKKKQRTLETVKVFSFIFFFTHAICHEMFVCDIIRIIYTVFSPNCAVTTTSVFYLFELVSGCFFFLYFLPTVGDIYLPSLCFDKTPVISFQSETQWTAAHNSNCLLVHADDDSQSNAIVRLLVIILHPFREQLCHML
jgi:hypothetical protein